MHSMHQVRSLSSGPLIQQQQQLVQQQELSGVPSSQQQQQQEQLSMTVLESLEPVQASQQQQAVIHHLGPVQAAPPQPQPTIQLHQLQPSSRHLIEQQQRELERRDEEHHNTNGNLHQNQTSDVNVRQRQSGGVQLEGIVADGGGPIVQWLLENYEIADGESLPRSTVYNHYLAHCRSLRMSSVNAASFGKLIRSVFVGLKTRRLGTRGHSKYHYFGVRAKQHVRFDWLHEGSNGPDGGRAGCSSAMMRDETNSNCGSDGGGQCGSETDSTGNCSGRLSTSMSQLTNGNHHTSGGGGGAGSGQAQGQHVPDHQSSKRLKRLQVSNGMMPDNLNHNYQEHDGGGGGGATLEDLDHQHQNQHPHQLQLQQQHLHQNEMHYQDDLSQQQHQVPNGMHYGPVHQINGYAKQGPIGYTHEQFSGTAFGGTYDLASLRQHLNLERAATLVQESWPEREPNQLESQLRTGGSVDKQAVTSSEDKSDEAMQDFEQLINLIEPFERCYKSHFKRMVELMSELNFVELERLWCAFWQAPEGAQHWTTRSNSTIDAESNTQLRHSGQYANGDGEQLTFEQLRRLTSQPMVMERVAQVDRKLYSAIEGFLVVDMLSPMPRPLAQHLRSFALNICPWLEAALKGYSGDFVSRKLRSARAFEQALRRCTSINHLSAASRAIWSKRAVLAQMSADLSRLDLGDIEHQVASLMNQERFLKMEPAHEVGHLLMDGTSIELHPPNSSLTSAAVATMTADSKMGQNEVQMANDDIENSYTSQQLNTSQQTNASNQINTTTTTIATANTTSTTTTIAAYNCMEPGQLVQSFLRLLENPFPASAWPDWCRSLVESRVSGNSLEEASNFILRWNFYISLIMRELTLRSAPSLGSFQLIRLLFDEFIYYSVMSKLNYEKSAQKFHPSRV